MTAKKQDLAKELLVGNFERKGPDAKALTDPLLDTPMVLTLDQLRAYDYNPRMTRNPLYDEIKASILSRGLDNPPAVTRRPGEEKYIIRNGGNTRLLILQELWSETKDERFFRIYCLYRPWQSEIVALTGHLAENELHGSLTFIERALGVQKAQEIYEQDLGYSLTQAELAKRLSQDGFPCEQSKISRLQDAINYLLPALPKALYGGLNNNQVRKLLSLRQSALKFWIVNARGNVTEEDFSMLFQDVLSQFDAEPSSFDFVRMQDELIGQIAALTGLSYELILLELSIDKKRQKALATPPIEGTAVTIEQLLTPKPAEPEIPHDFVKPDLTDVLEEAESFASKFVMRPHSEVKKVANGTHPASSNPVSVNQDKDDDAQARMQAHIVSPANISERVHSIQKMVAEHTGEEICDFADNAVKAIPVQAGGLYPISDVWFIEPAIDSPVYLRQIIEQLAVEIADEVGLKNCIEQDRTGIGFLCKQPNEHPILVLLAAISSSDSAAEKIGLFLSVHLAALLIGSEDKNLSRMSDESIVKLFRIIRLSRRLIDLEMAN